MFQPAKKRSAPGRPESVIDISDVIHRSKVSEDVQGKKVMCIFLCLMIEL